MSKLLGKMMTGSCRVCGGMVAGMWLDDDVTEREKKLKAGKWALRGLDVRTVTRDSDDPMPLGCDDRSHRKEV